MWKTIKNNSIKSSLTIKLQTVIVLLVIVSVAITFLNNLASVYFVQKKLLTEFTEKDDLAYSSKLAYTLDGFFNSAKRELEHTAQEASTDIDKPQELEQLTQLVFEQNNFFNSVGIVNQQNVVVTVAPARIKAIGKNTQVNVKNYQLKKTNISQPLYSVIGNLIVMVTAPLKNTLGEYQGYIAGTIYLKSRNMLSDMMRNHFHRINTNTMVVSSDGTILYHEKEDKIGSKLAQAILASIGPHAEGVREVKQADGQRVIVGFAKMSAVDWTVITLTTGETITQAIRQLMQEVLKTTVPVLLITLLFIAIAARKISRPLNQLAECADRMNAPTITRQIDSIHAFYFEAQRLRKMMKSGIGSMHDRIGELHAETLTDPLTGLYNRRALAPYHESLANSAKTVSLMLIDIDRFKCINDNKGHDFGDVVLKRIAEHLRTCTRSSDVIFRIGGDEFLILLPDTTLQEAVRRGRCLLNTRELFTDDDAANITLSLGISSFMSERTTLEYAIKMTDIALYRSKQNGRNRLSEIAL